MGGGEREVVRGNKHAAWFERLSRLMKKVLIRFRLEVSSSEPQRPIHSRNNETHPKEPYCKKSEQVKGRCSNGRKLADSISTLAFFPLVLLREQRESKSKNSTNSLVHSRHEDSSQFPIF